MLNQPLIHAAAIDLRWQKALETASSTPPPTSESTSLLPSRLTGTTTSPPTPTTAEQGLDGSQDRPVGVKVGIGVGVGVGSLLLSIIAFLVYRLRRARSPKERHHDEAVDPQLGSQNPSSTPPYGQTPEMLTDYNRHEADSAHVHEIYSTSPKPAELPSTPDATSIGWYPDGSGVTHYKRAKMGWD